MRLFKQGILRRRFKPNKEKISRIRRKLRS